MLKGQLEQAKEQLKAMPVDQQEMACKQGIEAMKMAEEQMKKLQG
ncbi:MAG: hypothetical protein XXXJIFNMEKO3_03381 [Candidatus Erwinia impunctatus]|nr:hypothetical protein XXXJIFNMEKO_03381 [Culicoides impunctatus]